MWVACRRMARGGTAACGDASNRQNARATEARQMGDEAPALLPAAQPALPQPTPASQKSDCSSRR